MTTEYAPRPSSSSSSSSPITNPPLSCVSDSNRSALAFSGPLTTSIGFWQKRQYALKRGLDARHLSHRGRSQQGERKIADGFSDDEARMDEQQARQSECGEVLLDAIV